MKQRPVIDLSFFDRRPVGVGISVNGSARNAASGETDRPCFGPVIASVILIDVYHFKRFNDSNGHQAGDQCLSTVADVLSASAKRTMDVIGRYGGDEFIMILPNTDASAAARIA